MTEFNNNNKYIPKAPETYEVRFMENENKQAGLSPAARAKIINHSGSNYISERANEVNPAYGPGLGDDLKELGQGLGKVAGSIALAATTVVCPPVGMAATAAIGVSGAVMTHGGRETGDKDLEKAGMTTRQLVQLMEMLLKWEKV